MSVLPAADGFPSHKAKFTQAPSHKKQTSKKDIDLNRCHNNFVLARIKQQDSAMHRDNVVNPTTKLYSLFNKEFFFSFDYQISFILKKYLGYSNKDESLSVSILNNSGTVMSIALRCAADKNGDIIKWKNVYGSDKTYVPFKIEDDFIFLAVGMAEFLLFEIMKVSYLLLQADGMYRHIPDNVVNKAKNKTLIILKENDKSFTDLIIKLQSIFVASNVVVIDFEKVLNRTLHKGYDFRDFCNEMKSITIVEQKLEEEIIKQIKDKK